MFDEIEQNVFLRFKKHGAAPQYRHGYNPDEAMELVYLAHSIPIKLSRYLQVGSFLRVP